MMLKQQKLTLENFLLNQPAHSSLFYNMLTIRDLVSLLHLNRNIRKSLKQRKASMNQLYYLLRLTVDKSLHYDFYYEEDVRKKDEEKATLACSTSSETFWQNLERSSQWTAELANNLERLMDEGDIVHEVTGRFSRILKEPDLPLPKLRKDDLGQYCETQLQTEIALMDDPNVVPQPLQQPFVQLKRGIINNEQSILNSFHQVDPNLLMDIRYRPESLSFYTQTECSFINIIQLILLQLNNHVSAIRKLINSYDRQLNDKFIEFNLRYVVYRYSIIQLQEQLGFLFEHFNLLFQVRFPYHRNKPALSVWRTMLKIWLRYFQQIHNELTMMCNYLLVVDRERNIREMLQSDTDTFTSDHLLKFSKLESFSSLFHKKHLNNYLYEKFLEERWIEPVLRDYREYQYEMSTNEVRIHWCGATDFSVSQVYQKYEQKILEINADFFKHLSGQMNEDTMKQLLEREVCFLNDRIKLSTMYRIISQWEQLRKGEEPLLHTLDNNDEQINFGNYRRNVPTKQSPLDLHFYDLCQTVSQEKVDKMAKEKADEEKQSDDDCGDVESYISSEDDTGKE